MNLNELRTQMIKSVKKDIKEEYTETDLHITKSINLIDALNETINLLTEHLREWHAIHFPELNQLIKSNEEFIELIKELTERKNFTEKNISKIIKDNELNKKIALNAKNSSGQETEKNTLNEMKKLSEKILSLKKEREELTSFIEKEMKKKWPNYSNECGAVLGARILAKLGSGKKLAFAPSSTIQVVGAEKALFEALKKRKQTPKHGYLYAHPLVQQTNKQNKGKIARKISGKISIAAKKDYFSKTHKAIEKPKTIKEIKKEEFNKKYQKGNITVSIKQKKFNNENKNFKEKNFKRKPFKNKFKKNTENDYNYRNKFKRNFEDENEFNSRNKFNKKSKFKKHGNKEFDSEKPRFKSKYKKTDSKYGNKEFNSEKTNFKKKPKPKGHRERIKEQRKKIKQKFKGKKKFKKRW